jgi:protein-L-isoaspartate O-methyltransferase
LDWAKQFYTTRSEWFGPTGIFPEHQARALDLDRWCGSSSKRVLDLGAGAGGTAAALADRGHTVVAVEFSPVRATFARSLAPDTTQLNDGC